MEGGFGAGNVSLLSGSTEFKSLSSLANSRLDKLAEFALL